MHASSALNLSGTPIGLTAAKFWTRKKFKGSWALRRHVNPIRVPIETNEDYRWLDNLRQSIALLGTPERYIHVGDRESDIYELFCLAEDLCANFLVRMQANLRPTRPCASRKAGPRHLPRRAQAPFRRWQDPHCLGRARALLKH